MGVLLRVLTAAASAGVPSIDLPLRTGAAAPGDAAVVVGVDDYQAVPDVPFAARDAAAMWDALVHTVGIPSANVALLGRDADRERILAAMAAAVAAAGPEGTVWFSFVGHGAVSPRNGERLLLGDDVQPDAASLVARGVAIRELEALARERRLVLVIDAAFGGAGRDGADLVPGLRSRAPADPPRASTRALEWVSAAPDEVPEALLGARHGAFTYFVVGALRGWADGALGGPRDGAVTAAEAEAFVARGLRAAQVYAQQPALRSGVAPATWRLSAGATEGAPPDDALATLRAAPAVASAAPAAPAPTGPPQPSTNPRQLLGASGLVGRGYALRSLVPAVFEMGWPEEGWFTGPPHRVRLTRPIAFGETEVTQALYEAVTGQAPWLGTGNLAYDRDVSCATFGVGPDLPAFCVTWLEAVRFCNALSVQEKLRPAYQLDGAAVTMDLDADGYRLPTEAEWEYAARARVVGAPPGDPHAARPFRFASADDPALAGWIGEMTDWKRQRLHPVAQKRANLWGLYDLSGNVAEWVWDRSVRDGDPQPGAPDPTGAADGVDPVGTCAAGDPFVLRGGSAFFDGSQAHVAARVMAHDDERRIDVGFRVVRTLPAAPAP